MRTSNIFTKEVVHIGCFSHMPGSDSGPRVKPDTHYTCFELIDQFKAYVDQSYDEIPEPYKRQVDLIFADAHKTNLRPQSVDEIHMYNVIGDPAVENIDGFFSEAKRILKPEGLVYVGETMLPYGRNIESMICLSRKHNFSTTVLVPHIHEYVSSDELKRFYEIIDENATQQAYIKNFDEWFDLLNKMHLLERHECTFDEMMTLTQYKGDYSPIAPGSYLVRLTQKNVS